MKLYFIATRVTTKTFLLLTMPHANIYKGCGSKNVFFKFGFCYISASYHLIFNILVLTPQNTPLSIRGRHKNFKDHICTGAERQQKLDLKKHIFAVAPFRKHLIIAWLLNDPMMTIWNISDFKPKYLYKTLHGVNYWNLIYYISKLTVCNLLDILSIKVYQFWKYFDKKIYYCKWILYSFSNFSKYW